MKSVRTLAALACALSLVGCSGSEKAASGQSPADLLSAARQTLDATQSVHVKLAGTNVPSGLTNLQSAEGDIARPDKFKGTATSATAAEVVSVGGTFYVKLFGTWAKTTAASLGLPDPGKLLSPTDGITSLLAAATSVEKAGETREGSEVLTVVSAKIPADAIKKVLGVTPTQEVVVKFGIADEGHQLRRAELTGPFYDKATQTTYVVTVTDYGKAVDIKAPN